MNIPLLSSVYQKKGVQRGYVENDLVSMSICCVLSQTTLYLIFVKLLKKEEKERKKSRKQQKAYKKATF